MSATSWITRNRQMILARMVIDCANNCLLGHHNCQIIEHYVHTRYQFKTVAKAVEVQCLKEDGTPLKDDNGNELYITVYESEKTLEQRHKLLTQYEYLSDNAVKNWKIDDREQSEAEWKKERKAIHSLNEKAYKNGRFGSVSSVIFHEKQPLYYVEAIGMNGLTCQPFAKVKLSGSYFHLYVDLGDSLRTISKHRRRKAIRYNKPLPTKIDAVIAEKVEKAVQHFLS